MTWTGVTVTPGNPTKALELNTVQDNITAQANGDSGAPKQQYGSIDNAAVSRDNLKTDQGSVVTVRSTTSAASGSLLLPGGEYGFYPTVGITTTTATQTVRVSMREGIVIAAGPVLADSYVGVYTAANDPGESTTVTIYQRYIEASPPYDLGDGDVPCFTFVKMNTQNEILSVYSASVPPWAYNGPTSVTPDRVDIDENGILRKYKNVMISKPTPPWEGGDVAIWEAGPIYQEREIDNSIKNADMDLIPHPFGQLAEGERVVILDPCCDMGVHLSALNNSGDSVAEMVTKGYIELGDTINCCVPREVTAVRASWKNNGSL